MQQIFTLEQKSPSTQSPWLSTPNSDDAAKKGTREMHENSRADSQFRLSTSHMSLFMPVLYAHLLGPCPCNSLLLLC